jgi:hypothetical protein
LISTELPAIGHQLSVKPKTGEIARLFLRQYSYGQGEQPDKTNPSANSGKNAQEDGHPSISGRRADHCRSGEQGDPSDSTRT